MVQLQTWSTEWCYANRQKFITNRKRRNKEVFQYRMEPTSKRSSGVKSSQEAVWVQWDKQMSLGGRQSRAITPLDGPRAAYRLALLLRAIKDLDTTFRLGRWTTIQEKDYSMYVSLYPFCIHSLPVVIAEYKGLNRVGPDPEGLFMCFMSAYKHLFCTGLLLNCRIFRALCSKYVRSYTRQDIPNA